jgi:hypothetical protein
MRKYVRTWRINDKSNRPRWNGWRRSSGRRWTRCGRPRAGLSRRGLRRGWTSCERPRAGPVRCGISSHCSRGSRLETLHGGKLLADEELYAVEDIIAEEDDADEKVAALITLSGKMVADGAFARQLRRKYA